MSTGEGELVGGEGGEKRKRAWLGEPLNQAESQKSSVRPTMASFSGGVFCFGLGFGEEFDCLRMEVGEASNLGATEG